MQVIRKVGSILVSVVLWAVILLAALYAFTTLATRDNNSVANFLGYTPLTVRSDSMAPTFEKDDLIFIKTCDPSKLKEGDIICFHTIIENEYALNTHRISAIAEQNGFRSYTTRGDNNPVDDTHIISDGDIVGKYVGHVPGLGKVMDFIGSSTGLLVVIVLPMLLFLIYQIYHLISVGINLKRAIALEAEEERAARNAEQQQGEVENARSEAEEAKAEADRLREEAAALRAALEEAKKGK